MLDRILDALDRFGVSRTVVNAYHLAGQIQGLVEQRVHPAARISLESERLETGGGVRRALPYLGHDAFFVTNADLVLPRADRAFRVLEQHWDPQAMDALLLVIPRGRATGYTGSGDFALRSSHTGAAPLTRAGEGPHPYVFTGIQVLAHSLFKDTPDGPFPLGLLYRRARLRHRLFGIVHKGAWFHVGTVQAVGNTERLLAIDGTPT